VAGRRPSSTATRGRPSPRRLAEATQARILELSATVHGGSNETTSRAERSPVDMNLGKRSLIAQEAADAIIDR